MKMNFVVANTAAKHKIRKARQSVATSAVTLSMLATLGSTVVSGINPNVAYAQGNVGQFDISDVLVEESRDGDIRAQDVALDPSGNRYIFGNFNGTVQFGEGRGAQEVEGTDGDLFVAKYDVDSKLVWVQKFDASTSQRLPSTQPTGIKFDDTFDNVFIAGSFVGSLAIGSDSLVTNNNANGFVAQLDPETGEAQWANQIVSSKLVKVSDLSTNGNLAVTGAFDGIAEFDGQSNSGESLLALSPGGSDMFTAVYAFDGSLTFVLQAGGDDAEGASVDFGGGTINVAGDFDGSIRFPDRTGKQPAELTSNGSSDGFVVSYTRGGQQRFVTQIGGTESDAVRQIVSKSFQLYVAGNFKGESTIGQTTLTSRGGRDIFIAQINSFGGAVDAVTQAGGSNDDVVHSLDADKDGNLSAGTIFIGGEFESQSMTIGRDSSPVKVENPNGAPRSATYLTGLTVDVGKLQPSFAQAVEGKFFSRGLTVDDAGTNLFLPGRYTTAVTFGEGERTIELPAPAGEQVMAVAHFTPATGDESAVFYVSSSSGGTVDGIDFEDEDVLVFSPERQRWAMLIDGSDLGLGAVDIDAFHRRADGTVLLSIEKPASLPQVGNVDDSDILVFKPEQLGDETSGSLAMFLRGADVGLTTSGEDIDAITFDTDGRLVISTLGSARVPGLNGTFTARDEDLLVRNGDTWELLFDGSDVGLENSQEDIKGTWIDANGFAFTTLGLYEIGSLKGAADDVINCEVINPGEDTEVGDCTILFDSGANGMANEVIDAIAIDPVGSEGSAISDLFGLAPRS